MKRKWIRGIAVRFYYPFLLILGSFFKEKKESFLHTLINLNNRLVRSEKPKAKRLLLLLPHCLQTTDCNIRLTHNIYNCEKCGNCEIKDLIEIAEENHLDISVATGGTLARKIVKDVMPEAIIAVACERDLSSGIIDTYPLPILGITNERPYGPCVNTWVDLDKIREAIIFFCKD